VLNGTGPFSCPATPRPWPVPLENRIRLLACGFVVASGGSAVFVDQPAATMPEPSSPAAHAGLDGHVAASQPPL